MRIVYGLAGLMIMLIPIRTHAQELTPGTEVSLEQCIEYAMQNQPALKQVEVAEEIAQKDVDIRLASWLPQINGTANVIDNLKRPTNILQIGDSTATLVSGAEYTSTLGVSVNQVIFSNDVLLAANTASEYKRQAQQNTEQAKIDVVVNVSKAYYQVLTTKQQIEVLDQTIERLEKNFKDAKNRYQVGVSDKIDYSRAEISLNNTKAQRKGAIETYKTQKAMLKQYMGYPIDEELTIANDVTEMETESLLDTTSEHSYANRIEYQLIQTQKQLTKASISYYKKGIIPTLSAYYNYNWVFQNNEFSELYSMDYPNSAIGLQLSVPIFTGLRRTRNIQKSKLQFKQLELQEQNLQSQINTQYVQALGTYKSNLEQLQASRANYDIADDVYNTVKLQYNEGIKAYLEVIVAESDLRTSQLNYLNALLNVLSSKLDVQKAAGTINITQY